MFKNVEYKRCLQLPTIFPMNSLRVMYYCTALLYFNAHQEVCV